jgi:hypothetical protein
MDTNIRETDGSAPEVLKDVEIGREEEVGTETVDVARIEKVYR